MASNTIDLNQVDQTVSWLTINDDNDIERREQEYQPKTLQKHNRTRCVYLPLFPTKSASPHDSLLLTNVPASYLAPHELARRQHGACTSDALMLMNNYQYSDKDGFSLSEQDAEELSTRLRVGKSIITFNADRLRGICYTLCALHESFRRNVLHQTDVALKDPILNSKQMAIALEFFLRMDVDIFYMKTCSFREVQLLTSQSSNNEGFFCDKDEFEARYALLPCSNSFCSCCYAPTGNWKKNHPWPVVDFASSSTHQFVNGYTTYLNCPATCDTKNIVYTMTCPCGYYDYVDSTAETLTDAMAYHRRHGNRIVHEMLTGSSLFLGIPLDPNERKKEIAKKMRLYQHSARCPAALRLFLDCNPDYWCFIPLLWHEAHAENMAHLHETSTSSSKIVDIEAANIIAIGAIGNHKVARCLENVPQPPGIYVFSCEQTQKQRLFFENFLLSNIDQLPYSPVDLYQVSIIAVLPDDCSRILRYIIETLFIIHGETKLNMICPIGGDPKQRYGRPYNLVWCDKLNCPFIATAISTQ